MSDPWDRSVLGSPEYSREFLVSVELYISNAAGASLRKSPINRKKTDRREAGGDDSKLKEKSSASWLSLQKGLNTAGQWRTATCRLLEEGDRSLLNVYVDESILYQTVYIHLLNQTDIRQADNSLFYRKDCLGIFCIAGQRWTSSHTAEPLYLQFANAETCSIWQALLKSYAIPEIYGRWFFPVEGGSYRMWRQVELTVIQGRNLGGPVGNPDAASDHEGSEFDTSCEIHLNSILCARTTVKRSAGSADWHESFTFTGLPPFEALEIVIWRENKSTKPAVFGKSRVILSNFRRGDAVEGWFPVLQEGFAGLEIQTGEVRLKIRVDEEIILPVASYAGLMATCGSRNILDWMNDLENKLKLKSISPHLMPVAVARETVIKHVQAFAMREVDSTSTSHQTLFRGNTTLTKVVELCMTWYGKTFLEASVGTVLRRLCAEKVGIEVDPMRSGKGTRDVEKNVEQLIYWCQEFWNQIYSVRSECPNEMRVVFKTIRELVEKRYLTGPTSAESNVFLPWQSVSAFCFLRFIVPAILHPHLFGLCPGLPTLPVQRSLTLIAKVIQSLANLNTTVQKETFMRGVQDFLKNSAPGMIDYIKVVSTPSAEAHPSGPAFTMDRHDRLNIVNSLHQRTKNMTILDRESVPNPPHLLDIPRHLAIITSEVIRSSRALITQHKSIPDEADEHIERFCARCLEVEKEAMQRVRQLAAKLEEEQRSLSSPETPRATHPILDPNFDDMPRSPISTVTGTFVSAGGSYPQRQKSNRPSTAPSPQEAYSSGRRQILTGELFTAFGHTLAGGDHQRNPASQNTRTLHTKAPSTDSIPSLGSREILSPIRLPHPRLVSSHGETTEESGKPKKGLLRGILRL